MKQLILALATVLFLASFAYAQEQQCPQRTTPRSQQSQRPADAAPICLESFEMCNNWARHYCRAGNHEGAVNNILRNMKERGVTITTAIIKSVARRTLKNAAQPQQPTAE